MSINLISKILFIVGTFSILTSGILSWIDRSIQNRKINKLQIEIDRASRGISVSYDFNDTRRVETRPGHINLEQGVEVAVFNKMLQLENENRLAKLENRMVL